MYFLSSSYLTDTCPFYFPGTSSASLQLQFGDRSRTLPSHTTSSAITLGRHPSLLVFCSLLTDLFTPWFPTACPSCCSKGIFLRLPVKSWHSCTQNTALPFWVKSNTYCDLWLPASSSGHPGYSLITPSTVSSQGICTGCSVLGRPFPIISLIIPCLTLCRSLLSITLLRGLCWLACSMQPSLPLQSVPWHGPLPDISAYS